MPASFDRMKPILRRTFALRTFNQCESEINRHYWSFKVQAEYAAFIARAEKKRDPNALTKDMFKASGPDAPRIPKTVSEWLAAKNDLENWLRLAALISASSYLETYLRQVMRTALMAHPLCRFGLDPLFEGVKLLKAGIEIDYGSEVEEITRGDWNQRAAAFRKFFGTSPLTLTKHLDDLEKIRILRNRFAHGGGRALDAATPCEQSLAQTDRLSEDRLKAYLGILSKVAAGVDNTLLHSAIGNFELLYYYHEWRSEPMPRADRRYGRSGAFKRSLARDAGVNVSKQFCERLIDYYDKI